MIKSPKKKGYRIYVGNLPMVTTIIRRLEMDNFNDAAKAEFVDKINVADYEASPWDFGNNLFYMLCALHPSHTEDSIIIAKTNTIRRVYSVQLERKILNKESSEIFYKKTVACVFKDQIIDNGIKKLIKMNCSLSYSKHIVYL